MVYFDESYLTIQWDKDTQCVVMQWKKFIEGESFRKGLETGLKLVQEKHSKRWLADLRKLGVVTQEDQQWSNEVWFPRALNSTLQYMAIVVPENIIAKWSVDRIMTKVEGANLVTHYFDSTEKAKAWLRSQP